MRPVSSRFLQSSSSFGRASPSPRTCARENEGEREKSVLSRESSFFSSSLALRFFHPFLLSPPFSLSSLSSGSLFFFLSLSIASSRALRAVIAHGCLSSVSLIFLLSLGRGASSFSLVLRVVLFLFFLPSSYSPAGGSFSIRVHTRESISSPRPPSPAYCTPSSFFVPVDRAVLHSSNLNAGRTGVLYRLRK